MSYTVLRVYNFDCDWPDCEVSNAEVLPMPSTLREALRLLRKTEHWAVKDGKHYCPKHD